MVSLTVAVLVFSAAFAAAYPANDPVIGKWSEGLRYDYLEDDAGNAHLVDNWLKISDYDRLARYNPDQTNRYHLFTISNPIISQPLALNNAGTVTNSNFNRNHRTVVLMHGFAGSITSSFNTVLLPAFLAAGNVNVIIVDWSDGSSWGPRATQAGQAAGRFINWLNNLTGASPSNYILCGFSVGGHGVGHMGRTINGNVGYILSLDPANRWDTNLLFRPSDGTYTEVIHTNGDDSGWLAPLGDVDFYPNGGRSMPGCWSSLYGTYTEVIHTNGDDSGWLAPLGDVDFYPNGGRSMPGCWSSLCNHNRPSDGTYTEVIHTNGDDSGWLAPLGDVDFYPNGGKSMPGCWSSLCNHNRLNSAKDWNNLTFAVFPPANRWDTNLLFRPSDGTYTEVIHTNGDDSGWLAPLGDVDFYPNGGRSMPGCWSSLCNHNRAYNYMAESLRTGGFTGRRCDNLNAAVNGNCNGSTLRMGGITPKTGSTGLYHLTTNPIWPFSQG
ncbi:hypothetical protein PYW07_012752 [Mythimna separata]|uniref:Lipase domain-containing protein n=1 Tax=Mythimna separata TaxID=271217 RepID=A0AAD7Y944_MYTSE|nr:hypothetical protein PYW07_012752 [Mythimna separata]